jgi:hypothetical protein
MYRSGLLTKFQTVPIQRSNHHSEFLPAINWATTYTFIRLHIFTFTHLYIYTFVHLHIYTFAQNEINLHAGKFTAQR